MEKAVSRCCPEIKQEQLVVAIKTLMKVSGVLDVSASVVALLSLSLADRKHHSLDTQHNSSLPLDRNYIDLSVMVFDFEINK